MYFFYFSLLIFFHFSNLCTLFQNEHSDLPSYNGFPNWLIYLVQSDIFLFTVLFYYSKTWNFLYISTLKSKWYQIFLSLFLSFLELFMHSLCICEFTHQGFFCLIINKHYTHYIQIHTYNIYNYFFYYLYLFFQFICNNLSVFIWFCWYFLCFNALFYFFSLNLFSSN